MSHLRGRKRTGCGLGLVSFALVFASLLAPSAQAETRTFLNLDTLQPVGGAGTSGPAGKFPSTIVVSGLPGKVTKATVTLLGYGAVRPDDADILITGPNGQKVMLMSDVCGDTDVDKNEWVFDDSAPTFLSNIGPCGTNEAARYKPTSYLGNAEPDDFSTFGGPPPPYLNALSFFNGSSPNGTWSLYLVDDETDFALDVQAWALTLDIAPPVSCAGTRTTRAGTAGNDVIRGTAGRDAVAGLGGNDVVRGLGGNDIICGGAGKDRLIGGAGKDRLLGQGGGDTLKGGGGNDACVGGKGADLLRSC